MVSIKTSKLFFWGEDSFYHRRNASRIDLFGNGRKSTLFFVTIVFNLTSVKMVRYSEAFKWKSIRTLLESILETRETYKKAKFSKICRHSCFGRDCLSLILKTNRHDMKTCIYPGVFSGAEFIFGLFETKFWTSSMIYKGD